jgi:mannose-6-phosphate isomerase-like protein (cupin superfamily)
MKTPSPTRRYEVVDFDAIDPVQCPCGLARRALVEAEDFPGTLHRTEVLTTARLHYHKQLTELYYILECESDGAMELDGDRVPVRPGMSILIRPGVRHRGLGRMRVLIFVLPKFDPADEWFD